MLTISPELEQQYRELAQQLNRPFEDLINKALTNYLKMRQNAISRQNVELNGIVRQNMELDELLNSINKSGTTVLYPSSCQYHVDFQNLEFDNVILCSNGFRESSKIGKVFCVNADNNTLLGMLQKNGIKLNAVVIICDGCREGGNYECCAEMPFFHKLMPLFAGDFLYFSDHGIFAEDNPRNYFEDVISFESVETPSFVNLFKRRSSSYHTFNCSWKIKKQVSNPIIQKFKNVELVIHNQSIWDNHSLLLSNNLFLERIKNRDSKSFQNNDWCKATEKYLVGLDLPAISKLGYCGSFPELLSISNEQKLDSIVFIPFNVDCYDEISEQLTFWIAEFPKQIHLFHARDKNYL